LSEEIRISAIIMGFLEGIYFSGNLPSRKESYDIARYVKTHEIVPGTLLEIEKLVMEKMTVMHEKLSKKYERLEENPGISAEEEYDTNRLRKVLDGLGISYSEQQLSKWIHED
jgi:hypothetical protein